MTQPRVLLAQLHVCTARDTGKVFYTGFLGASRLLGWPGPPDKYGQPTIDLFLQPKKEQFEERRELAAVDGNRA